MSGKINIRQLVKMLDKIDREVHAHDTISKYTDPTQDICCEDKAEFSKVATSIFNLSLGTTILLDTLTGLKSLGVVDGVEGE